MALNPYAPNQKLAFRLLKDAGYAPDWIELDKAVRSRQEVAIATLARARGLREECLNELEGRSDETERATADWQRAVLAFVEEVTAINGEIATLNLKVPSPRFQQHKLDAESEVEMLEAGSE